jgi:hypothetical protein
MVWFTLFPLSKLGFRRNESVSGLFSSSTALYKTLSPFMLGAPKKDLPKTSIAGYDLLLGFWWTQVF